MDKPGYKTSEFWIHIIVGVAITALTELDRVVDTAGLPPLVAGAYKLIAPLALAFLAKNYQSGRIALKSAALAAPAKTPDEAVEKLKELQEIGK